MEQKQYAFSLDSVTVKKIFRGAMIAGGGALCVYLLQVAAQMDFGDATPIVGAFCSVAINAVREYMKGQ